MLVEEIGGIKAAPFTWFVCDDAAYYQDAVNSGSGVLIAPSRDDIIGHLRSGKGVPPVIAPYPPPSELSTLFVVRVLPPVSGGITSQEVKALGADTPEELRREHRSVWKKVVEEKLQISIYEPTLRLEHLVGMEKLKEVVRQIKATERDPKLRYKGVFLVGIPGVGKSYSAKCVAGELNRWLVELSMGYIVDMPNPVHHLRKIFAYLEQIDIPVLLWIDEIEKPIADESGEVRRIVGELLRILNDLGSETGYKIDAIFWMTANRIEEIEKRYPELLRRGRVDVVFFVNTPLREDAGQMFRFYMKRFGLADTLSDADVDRILVTVDEVWGERERFIRDIEADRFVYTPAEIEQVCKEMARLCLLQGVKPEVSSCKFDELLRTACRRVYPVTISMSEAIGAMRSKKEAWDEV